MTQGIFVGHHDRTGAVLCITKNRAVRARSWTRQTLNDARESTNWDGLCATPWQMVTLELKLTKKVASDKQGAGLPLPRIEVERIPQVAPRAFCVCRQTSRLTVILEVVWVVQRWHRMEERSNHTTTNDENESKLLLGEP